MIRRKPAFGSLRNTNPQPWVRHVVEFGYLWSLTLTVTQMEHLAGVCDRESLWKACDRVFHGHSPWQRMMEILRSRARRRYLRGELLSEERIALKIWAGEDRQLPGFVRLPQDKLHPSKPGLGLVPRATGGLSKPAGVEGRLQISVNR